MLEAPLAITYQLRDNTKNPLRNWSVYIGEIVIKIQQRTDGWSLASQGHIMSGLLCSLYQLSMDLDGAIINQL